MWKEGRRDFQWLVTIDTSLSFPSPLTGQAPKRSSATLRGLPGPRRGFQQDQRLWVVSWKNCCKELPPHHPRLCDIRQVPQLL